MKKHGRSEKVARVSQKIETKAEDDMRDNSTEKKGREPVVISLTKKETESRRISPRRLKQAVEAIRRDGYVVIENAIPHEPLDMLREKMDQDSKVLIDREQWIRLTICCSIRQKAKRRGGRGKAHCSLSNTTRGRPIPIWTAPCR